jgi:hypothetical protein
LQQEEPPTIPKTALKNNSCWKIKGDERKLRPARLQRNGTSIAEKENFLVSISQHQA